MEYTQSKYIYKYLYRVVSTASKLEYVNDIEHSLFIKAPHYIFSVCIYIYIIVDAGTNI